MMNMAVLERTLKTLPEGATEINDDDVCCGEFGRKHRRLIAIVSGVMIISVLLIILAVVIYYVMAFVEVKIEEHEEYQPIDVEDPESGHKEVCVRSSLCCSSYL